MHNHLSTRYISLPGLVAFPGRLPGNVRLRSFLKEKSNLRLECRGCSGNSFSVWKGGGQATVKLLSFFIVFSTRLVGLYQPAILSRPVVRFLYAFFTTTLPHRLGITFRRFLEDTPTFPYYPQGLLLSLLPFNTYLVVDMTGDKRMRISDNRWEQRSDGV